MTSPMQSPFNAPDQLLAYKSLRQLLEGKPSGAYAVAPDDSVLSALQLMSDKGTGFVVVLDKAKLVGVLSERDYARKVELKGRSAKDTRVREIMVDKVVSVTVEHTVSQCMALMHDRAFRHLPVVDGDRLAGVLSLRDILKEIVEHHERLIRNLELERLTMLSSGASSY
ncbi:MAG TPA: CBS domain-containing protein [Casimicrobiaceae bacterium]|nr:CBS domain-containing protein [Casimicrobiaceae bacterium]